MASARHFLTFAVYLLALPLAQSETLPDAPIPTITRPAPALRVKSHSFLSNNLNRSLVAGEFSARLLDAVSTEQFEHDPCHCIVEKGSFYHLFSMKPIAASAPAMYAWSIGMAGAYTLGSRALWNHAEHSRHPKLYHLAARALLVYDLQDEAQLPINNWMLIATNGKRGL